MATGAPVYVLARSRWMNDLYAAFGLPADRVLSFRLDIRPDSLAIVEATLAMDVGAIEGATEVARRYAVSLHELTDTPE